MTEKASAGRTMFNVIDNLTDISQLTDYVFNNDEPNSSPNGLSSSNRGDSLNKRDEGSQATADNQKLATPNLEADTGSLLDHSLTDEEVFRYLSLFNDTSFQLVDELDLENTLQPCSSINSNATTVSTQETSEFRENLLSAEAGKEDGDERRDSVTGSGLNDNYQVATSSTANQTNVNRFSVHQTPASQANQMVYVTNGADMNVATNTASRMNDGNPMGQEMRVEYGQMSVNYYSNSQMNQFQYANSSPAPMSNVRMGDSMANNNLLPPINYRENTMNTFPAANGLQAPASYPMGNEYFTFAECRDVNCPYTYCSRYNPYYSFPSSFRNQFRSGFGENFLPDASTNMNLVDNQIVFSKQSDRPFNSVTVSSQTASATTKPTKRTKRKQPKSEYTETSVICNESTDFAFFTLEENLQSKRKRGRKKKASASDSTPEPSG